jgi:hypothetical protein
MAPPFLRSLRPSPFGNHLEHTREPLPLPLSIIECLPVHFASASMRCSSPFQRQPNHYPPTDVSPLTKHPPDEGRNLARVQIV